MALDRPEILPAGLYSIYSGELTTTLIPPFHPFAFRFPIAWATLLTTLCLCFSLVRTWHVGPRISLICLTVILDAPFNLASKCYWRKIMMKFVYNRYIQGKKVATAAARREKFWKSSAAGLGSKLLVVRHFDDVIGRVNDGLVNIGGYIYRSEAATVRPHVSRDTTTFANRKFVHTHTLSFEPSRAYTLCFLRILNFAERAALSREL